MSKKTRIGIVGYGNLGKGVEKAIEHNPDMELIAIFTRRNVKDIEGNNCKLIHISQLELFKGTIDVMILCGGSATDLMEQGPMVSCKDT